MAKSRQSKTIDFPLAHRGVYRSNAWGEQAAGFTPFAINALPYDSLGRLRPGQRGGMSKYWPMSFGAGFIQHLSVANVLNTVSAVAATRIYVIVACLGKVYAQLPGDAMLNRIDGGGGATFATGRKISAITLFNVTYFTDGLVVKQYDWASGSFGNWNASAGSFPIAGGEYPRILQAWRGRAILARLDLGDPSQAFLAEMGDPTNFDYGATPAPNMAIALNESFKAGVGGEGITAVMPSDNDFCYVSGENQLNVLRGDPGDGGSYVPVSTSVGVLSDTSWCQVRSAIYFIGTGGIYRLTPGSEPFCLTHLAINDAYRDHPHQGRYLACCYDKKRHGIWFFSTKVSDSTQTHYFYDLRAEEKHGIGGWWPVTFPANYSPSKAISFDGIDSTADARVILLGSATDGYVRTILDANVGSDDGDPITSSAALGVLQLAGPGGRFMVNGQYPVLGEQDADVACGWSLYGGPDPYSAFNGPAETRGGTFATGGRQSPLGTRLTANSVWLIAGNETPGKTWAVERWSVNVEPAGINR